MFWILGLGLAVLSFVVIVDVSRRGQGASEVSREKSALEIYKDQLAEIDKEEARGIIARADANAARIEVQRRILALGKVGTRPTSTSLPRVSVFLMALFVPISGIGLYSLTGSPNAISLPFADRAAEREESAEVEVLLGRLRQRLATDPNGGETEGWVLLANTMMNLERYFEAAEAYAVVSKRPEATSEIFAKYAESLIARDDGSVTPEAEAQIAKSLELDPKNPAAVFYQAYALQQRGDLQGAYSALVDRLGMEQSAPPWAENYIGQINRLAAALGKEPVQSAPGPSAADVQAAQEMSDEDREAFIRSMVEGLAQKMEENPDDLDGWIRLARAYTVLGDVQKAKSAYQSAKPLADALPAGDARKSVVDDGLAQ